MFVCAGPVLSVYLVAGGVVSSPLGSVDVLNEYTQVLRRKFSGRGLLTYKGETCVVSRVDSMGKMQDVTDGLPR